MQDESESTLPDGGSQRSTDGLVDSKPIANLTVLNPRVHLNWSPGLTRNHGNPCAVEIPPLDSPNFFLNQICHFKCAATPLLDLVVSR